MSTLPFMSLSTVKSYCDNNLVICHCDDAAQQSEVSRHRHIRFLYILKKSSLFSHTLHIQSVNILTMDTSVHEYTPSSYASHTHTHTHTHVYIYIYDIYIVLTNFVSTWHSWSYHRERSFCWGNASMRSNCKAFSQLVIKRGRAPFV